MSITSFAFELENATDYYRPGEVIRGQVVFEISGANSVLLKALWLKFSGFACTKWEKSEKLNHSSTAKFKNYIEYREDYVSTTSYLVGSEMAYPKPLEPGKYNYSFMINIPKQVPSTFESTLGFIRYEILVNLDYGDHTDCLYNSPVFVEQLKDLRYMDPAAQLPVGLEQLEQKSCFKFWQQPLRLYISIPQRAFISGECIPVTIKLTNSANLKLNTIISKLNRIVDYKGFTKEKLFQTTTEITTKASKIHNLYGQNLTLVQLSQEIHIPKTPPSIGFDECRCIRVCYELEVLVACENKKRWVSAKIPIIMGSVSLTSEVKILPLNLHNTNVASIAVATSMEELTLPAFMELDDNAPIVVTSTSGLDYLTSSFKKADFMETVCLNKKSRRRIAGQLNDFKPRYLYYEMPKE